MTENRGHEALAERSEMMMIMMMAWDELTHWISFSSVVALNTRLMRLTFCYLFNGMHTPSNLGLLVLATAAAAGGRRHESIR